MAALLAPDSTTAGYLEPSASAEYDDPLDNVLQQVIVGLTGLAGKWVRPRWQTEPPQQPDFKQDWAAFGIIRSTVDTFSHHRQMGEDSAGVERDELLYALHSFYGPHAHALCERFRDGLELSQNRYALKAAKLGLVEVGEATILPALLKEKWVRRIDVMVTYRRRTTRVYNVKSLAAPSDVETKIEDFQRTCGNATT